MIEKNLVRVGGGEMNKQSRGGGGRKEKMFAKSTLNLFKNIY